MWFSYSDGLSIGGRALYAVYAKAYTVFAYAKGVFSIDKIS